MLALYVISFVLIFLAMLLPAGWPRVGVVIPASIGAAIALYKHYKDAGLL